MPEYPARNPANASFSASVNAGSITARAADDGIVVMQTGCVARRQDEGELNGLVPVHHATPDDLEMAHGDRVANPGGVRGRPGGGEAQGPAAPAAGAVIEPGPGSRTCADRMSLRAASMAASSRARSQCATVRAPPAWGPGSS